MTETKPLLTPKEAAELMGVSVPTVKTWMHRADNPLPSVQVGKSGRVHRVVAELIDGWLFDESQRKTASGR